jgi:hypothetical protein
MLRKIAVCVRWNRALLRHFGSAQRQGPEWGAIGSASSTVVSLHHSLASPTLSITNTMGTSAIDRLPELTKLALPFEVDEHMSRINSALFLGKRRSMFHRSSLSRNGRRHFLNAFICVAAMFAGMSPALAGETTTYSYDALGRLINAAHSGTINSGLNQAYTHDAADNRANVTVTGSPYSSTTRVIVVPLLGLTVIVISP